VAGVGGEGEMHTGFWWGNLKGRGHLKNLGLDKSVILKWISGNKIEECGLDWCGTDYGQVANC
jgi:hypothetical protein